MKKIKKLKKLKKLNKIEKINKKFLQNTLAKVKVFNNIIK
jgi:hypothetical protein